MIEGNRIDLAKLLAARTQRALVEVGKLQSDVEGAEIGGAAKLLADALAPLSEARDYLNALVANAELLRP